LLRERHPNLISTIELNVTTGWFNATFTDFDYDELKTYFTDQHGEVYIAFRAIAYIPGSLSMDQDQDLGALTQSLWKITFLDSTVASACAANELVVMDPAVTFENAARDDVLTYQIQTAADIATNGVNEFIVPALKVTQTEADSCQMHIEVEYCDNNRYGDIIVDDSTEFDWDEEELELCIWQPVPLSDTTHFENDQENGQVYVSYMPTQQDFIDNLQPNFGPVGYAAYPEVTIRVRFVYYDVTKPTEKTYDELKLVVTKSSDTTATTCDYSGIMLEADQQGNVVYAINGNYKREDAFISTYFYGFDNLDDACKEEISFTLDTYLSDDDIWVTEFDSTGLDIDTLEGSQDWPIYFYRENGILYLSMLYTEDMWIEYLLDYYMLPANTTEIDA
jgi:hypothetical protein